jgi:hypothetical protein
VSINRFLPRIKFHIWKIMAIYIIIDFLNLFIDCVRAQISVNYLITVDILLRGLILFSSDRMRGPL